MWPCFHTLDALSVQACSQMKGRVGGCQMIGRVGAPSMAGWELSDWQGRSQVSGSMGGQRTAGRISSTVAILLKPAQLEQVFLSKTQTGKLHMTCRCSRGRLGLIQPKAAGIHSIMQMISFSHHCCSLLPLQPPPCMDCSPPPPPHPPDHHHTQTPLFPTSEM